MNKETVFPVSLDSSLVTYVFSQASAALDGVSQYPLLEKIILLVYNTGLSYVEGGYYIHYWLVLHGPSLCNSILK